MNDPRENKDTYCKGITIHNFTPVIDRKPYFTPIVAVECPVKSAINLPTGNSVTKWFAWSY